MFSLRFIFIYSILSFTVLGFSQSNHADSTIQLNNLIKELDNCKDDTVRLNKLFQIHYYQQSLIGELNETSISKFNTKYTKQAIALARDLKKFDTLKSLTIDLGYIFDLDKNFDSSFVYYNECLNVFEATNNFQLTYSITQNILYNNSMLQSIIAENNKKVLEQRNKIEKMTYFILAAVLLFTAFLVFFLVKIKRNNSLLTLQKDQIEMSKAEIDSSIDYAQNIQHAVLSNEIKLQKLIPNSFVLFIPRDKVSGDFLWSYKLGDDIYLAVADCTGHGVPGALLSIVGHFLFDSIVATINEKSPAKILEMLHQSIVKSLDQDVVGHKHNHDGMDVGLIKLNLITNKLVYAGAHRSLYHFRDENISELKGTRRPVGGTQIEYEKSFLDHEMELQKGDLVYCYSDGYQDQIGGPKNKKFMNKNLLSLIKSNCNNDLSVQKEVLETTFNNYKKGISQMDDVLMVGIRI
ncbi:MAG: SpoIIE family protein phosphatase [Bacteroidetes bacterium]|nr:SpoIIE family protein phosphatase [Bacteroidota bacterium]